MMKGKSTMRLMVLGLAAVLLASGCAGGAGGVHGAKRGWSPGMGALPNQIGSLPDSDDGNAGSPPVLFVDDLPARTGFADPTGKWFFKSGKGKLGYGLTGGVQRPGNELSVQLFGHAEGGVQVDRDVRIRLIARTPDLAEKAVVLDETVHVGTVTGKQRIYGGVIPKEENALYTLSAEVLDADGRVEDTRVSLIYVPKAEIGAALSTDRPVYGVSEKEGRLLLKNAGPTVLVLGAGYLIEKRVGDEWHVVPLTVAVPDIALHLPPGETHEEPFDLSRLKEGRYRIIKEIMAEGFDDLNAVLAAEFEVAKTAD